MPPADTSDPFAAAGFAPAAAAATGAPQAVDPFGAAGFAPVPTTPAKPTMPQPIGVTEFGAPIFADDKANAEVREGSMRASEKALEGATLGTAPFLEAGVKSAVTGQPYKQSLQEARDYTKKTSEDNPVGSLLAEGLGSLAPAAATGAVTGALAAPAAAVSRFGPWLAQVVGGGALGGATAAGHDVGSGDTANIGSDTAKGAAIGGGLSAASPLLGALLQTGPNMIRSGIQAGKTLFTGPGHDAVAGQILREAGGDFANTAANSPIPGLTLRTAQATGNPGLASLERTLASEPGMQAGTAGDLVNNGRTPNQMSALAQSLVGSDAGIEPSVLTNTASARGTQAVTAAQDALRNHERQLWNAPALTNLSVPRADVVAGVQQDIANMPPSLRMAINNSHLPGFIQDLAEGNGNATIADINAVRSRVLSAARDARASGDNVTGSAAESLANSLLDRTGAIAGNGGQDAMDAYAAARNFTRQRGQALGYPEFDAILRPNRAGNMRANDETAFGRFLDTSGGTDTGLQRLQGVSDLLRASGNHAAADELDQSAQQYARAAVLRQARAGSGLDATGAPVINPQTLASTVNKTAPALSGTPMTAPIAGDVQAAGNAAELLNRPSTLRGDNNSTTFEKLRNHDLVSAILGQSGSSALGAVGGGAAGYEYGPESIPWYLRIPGGALAGALMGQKAGPLIGRTVSHIPGVSAAVTGPTDNIMRRVMAGLATPEEYARLVATTLPTGPALSAPGALSRGVPMITRSATPTIAEGATR